MKRALANRLADAATNSRPARETKQDKQDVKEAKK
jgi:hypothetical protein